MSRLVLPILLGIEIALFTTLSHPSFDSFGGFVQYFRGYFQDLLAHAAPDLLMAAGLTIVLMSAGIDLSVASMAALIAAIMALFAPGPAFWWTALPAGLLAGLLLGGTNGLLVARLDVPPVIATLGTMIFYRGLCYVLLGDREKAPFVDVPGFEWLGQFTGAMLLLGLVYLAGGIYFQHSPWRREVLTVGGNRIAARYAAIPVERRLLEVYTLAGFLAFLAALCFTARNSSVSGSSLFGVELRVIVAVVLGGTSVQGGRGSLYGTFFGVLLMAVLDEGLRSAARWGDEHLPFKLSHLQYLLLGVLLVGSVWLNRPSPRRGKQL